MDAELAEQVAFERPRRKCRARRTISRFYFLERRLELALPVQQVRQGNPDLMGLGRKRKDALVEQASFDQPPLVGKDVAKPGHDIEIGGLLGKTLAERSLGIDRIARAQGGYCLLDGESRGT